MTGSAIYTCPMHPEVQSDQAGICPKCGMKLVPKESIDSGNESSPATDETQSPDVVKDLVFTV